jgi:hypothetical protein
MHADPPVGISDTGAASAKAHLLRQKGRGTSRWGDETGSELGSPATRSPPPQPLPPTRIYPRDGDASNLPAPLSIVGSFQRLGLTPPSLRSLDHQRPVLTPLEPSPRRRPLSTSSDMSSCGQHFLRQIYDNGDHP